MLCRETGGARLILATMVLLFGCDDSDAPDNGGRDTDSGSSRVDGGDTGDNDDHLPRLDELDDGWNELLPGGDTVCARGEAFSFFVRPGTINKIVIDFMGGGACWDAHTCSPDIDDFYFADSVAPFRKMVEGETFMGFSTNGMYDRSRDDNPFKEWHNILIPYCTGDLHWGDVDRDYGSFRIEHRGAANSRAVLDWVFDNYSTPEQIFVTGCSAGSYGSVLWSAYVMQHYPSIQVIQLGDSGAGVTTPEFFEEYFPTWNAESSYPDWIPALDPATRDILYPDMYIGIADYYPTNFLSQFNYTYDGAQFFYFQEMGGTDIETMSAEIMASFDSIEAAADNFAVFVPSGAGHCVTPQESFYTVSADGTMFIDWLNELLTTGSVESAR